MTGKEKLVAPSSPYTKLRRDRPVHVDVHQLDLDSTPSFPGTGRRNVWIKPKSNAVHVPPEILEILTQDIEKRHAGQPQVHIPLHN